MADPLLEVRDMREKGFFMVDDLFVDHWACRVGPHANAVYGCLCRHANKQNKAWPSITTITRKTGVSRAEVMRSIHKLEAYNLIKADHELGKGNVYFILDKSVWTTSLTQIPVSHRYQSHTDTSLTQIPDQSHTDTRPVSGGDHPSYNVLKETKEGNKRRESKDHASDDALRLSILLFTMITQNNPRSRLLTFNPVQASVVHFRWAHDIDLLLRKDLQEHSHVEEVIKWATSDDFWVANILSGKALRKHWDTLVAQMERKKPAGSAKVARKVDPRPYRVEERPIRRGTRVDESRPLRIQAILDRAGLGQHRETSGSQPTGAPNE